MVCVCVNVCVCLASAALARYAFLVRYAKSWQKRGPVIAHTTSLCSPEADDRSKAVGRDVQLHICVASIMFLGSERARFGGDVARRHDPHRVLRGS